ncbi:hypothetical protein HIM_03448 [Hirsutella minnesotensis 3608]|uniref:DUF7896 domain-containing protein n=1 Tax=Hirsutella minnesotensis 3608 TaxID=1043627 RepID=A0A0F8A2N4_9HYPO|nr:hypothetical protein HIM_03448 [Hirsutella minnesotensis 3608]
MNLSFDNSAQEEEIEQQLSVHESLAAHYRGLLHGLKPACHPHPGAVDPFGSGYVNNFGLVSPDTGRASKRVRTADTSTAVRIPSGMTQSLTQPRAVSQQEHETSCMSRGESSQSDQGTSFKRLPTGPSSDHRLAPRSSPASRPLPSVQEDAGAPDVGLTPHEYLAKSWLDEHSYLSPAQTYYSPHPSACPSMVSGSSGMDAAHPLTRQSSSMDSHPDASMLRYMSTQSWRTDTSMGLEPKHASAAVNIAASSSYRDVFGAGSSFAREIMRGHPSSAPSLNAGFFPRGRISTSMERSVSGNSAASLRSTGSNLQRRYKEASQRYRQNGTRNFIAPKPEEEHLETTFGSTAPTKKEGKVALQKTPYQRPKHPRVYCNQCEDHPDGFRGDHELRRHLSAKHKGIVKKFVCRDPATIGIQSNVKALYPLSECRACTSKKQYGAYYNAAAHLRRTHFKPRAPRGKNKSPSEERRGGKGGGDWPPMSDLKLWYEEVHVASDGSNALDDSFEMEDETFESGEDVNMTMRPDLDGGPAGLGIKGVYGPQSTAASDGRYMQDVAASFDFSAGTASAPTMSYMGYAHMACHEQSSPEYTFYGDVKSPYDMGAPSFDASSLATSLYDANQAAPGYLWTMEDVESNSVS